MTALLPFEEAQRRLIGLAAPLGSEVLTLPDAIDRYLATPLLANRNQPPADMSAMDGYAISGSGPWHLIGESSAGHPYAGMLQGGEAARISTGALMPQGADRVLIQENATLDGDTISGTGELPEAGRHVRRKGFDFTAGTALLEAGTWLGPPQLALAMAGGHVAAEVFRQPSLAIVDSGDELSADPIDCREHQIPASNGLMLAAMAQGLVINCKRIGPVPDNSSALMAAFDEAKDAEVIVTSGGASVGDHDLVRPALEKWGAEIDFWRIAMRPGKPLLVARRGKQIILGLPGNPVSSFVTGYFFLLPLLRALSGAACSLPVPVTAELTGPLPAGGPRLHFMRAIYSAGMIKVIAEQDSSGLAALSRANALIERPAECGEALASDKVKVFLLQNGGIA